MPNIQFTPNSPHVEAGKTARIELMHFGLAHTFSIPDLGVDVTIPRQKWYHHRGVLCTAEDVPELGDVVHVPQGDRHGKNRRVEMVPKESLLAKTLQSD
jgi:hypothetical protein